MPCFASIIGNCSNDESREHYISESLLQAISSSNVVQIDGLPWLPEAKSIGIGRLTARSLCRFHNSALSPLDDVLGELQKIAEYIHAGQKAMKAAGLIVGAEFCMNRDLVERALLKLLVGCTYANALPSSEVREEHVPLSLPTGREYELIRRLFLGTPCEGPCNLAQIAWPDTAPVAAFTMRAAVGYKNEVVVLDVAFREMRMALVLSAREGAKGEPMTEMRWMGSSGEILLKLENA